MTVLAGLATIAGLAIAGLVVLLLVAVAAQHLRRTRAQARDARRRAELTPLVHELLDAAEEGEEAPDVAAAPAVLDELLLGLLPSLRGSDREVLRRVLVARGVVTRAAADLRALAAWRRGRAATLLGSAALADHTDDLSALLGDRSADVRSAAARALGKAGDAAAVEPLLAALSATPPLPHGVVGMAVLDLGTPVLPALRDALTGGAPAAQLLATELLGLHGDPAATTRLLTTLADPRTRPDVQVAAATALGRIGSPQATQTLVTVLETASAAELQRAAAEALGRIGHPSATTALTAGQRSRHAAVRVACTDALAAVGGTSRPLAGAR